MQPKRWILLALFLGAALLSAWLSPPFSSGWGKAASGPPETVLPGGMNGRTLLRSDEALDVKVAGVPGAHDIAWMLDGRRVGKAPDLHLQHLRDGEHILRLTYRDAQDRLFAATSLVRVLEAEPYAIQLATIQAAIYLPLWEEDFQDYLPIVRR
jgi:hypothetical protein